MHHGSHISEWNWWLSSGDIFTIDNSEQLHIGNVTEAYGSTNKLNYIYQMIQHNDQCTGFDYREETLFQLALQGCQDIDSAKVFNLLCTTDKRRNTHWAHLFHVQHCQDEPSICPASQQ
jgi:hypothetical protein